MKNFIELTPESESAIERNLVWVFGAPRSGTSWLALNLLSYKTVSVNETHLSDHLGDVEGDVKIQRRLERSQDTNYFFSNDYKNTWMFYLRKLILNRIFAQVQDLNKKIIIKEPAVPGASDIIAECLPNSKIIILLRDGRDILDSILDARQKTGFMTKAGDIYFEKTDRLKIIRPYSRWLALLFILLKKTYEDQPKEQVFLTKYEELRKNTVDVLTKIYKFLEIEISDEKLKEIVEKYSFENIPAEKKGSGKFQFLKICKFL